MYYKDFHSKSQICGDVQEFRTLSLKDRSCLYCKDRTHKGFKIECDINECKNCFHITCAANNDLIFSCDKMLEKGHLYKENKEYMAVFCREHYILGINIMTAPDRLSR